MAETVLLNLTFDNVKRASLQTEQNKVVDVPLTAMRVHDDFASLLPNAAAGDDLGLVMGTFGSASPSLQSSDFGLTTVTQYARFLLQIPVEWASTLKIRIHGGMLTTVSDTSATIDVEAYKSDEEAGIGSDLCTTAAQSINSLTLADKEFVIDTTGLEPGDVLDIRLTFAGNDGGDAGVMKGIIGKVSAIMDVRG